MSRAKLSQMGPWERQMVAKARASSFMEKSRRALLQGDQDRSRKLTEAAIFHEDTVRALDETTLYFAAKHINGDMEAREFTTSLALERAKGAK